MHNEAYAHALKMLSDHVGVGAIIIPVKEPWDPTHSSDRVTHHWTTTNLGEAVPGIITPLGMAHWGFRARTTAQRVASTSG